MKTSSTMRASAQALVMALALLACFTPALGVRDLKSTCQAAYDCAKCKAWNPDNGHCVIDRSGCGALLGVFLDINLLNLLYVDADVLVLCNGASCGYTYGDMCKRDAAPTCACTSLITVKELDICVL
jgi:hypothetical protein